MYISGYLYSPVHTINLSVFFTFTVFNSCFKFYMNMNMNVFSAVMDRTTSNDKLMSCPPSLAPFNSDNTSVRHNGQSVVSQYSQCVEVGWCD